MSVRDQIVRYAGWGVAHASQIHYAQRRPIDGIGHREKLPLTTDCSGFATDCFNWAGASDPNGRRYDGYGYTGSMLGACRHISRGQAEPGDLVVFGAGSGTHVVILVGTGSDPLVVSHGQEIGPIRCRLSVEARAHAGQPMTFLSATARNAAFAPPPPEEVETLSNPPTEEGLIDPSDTEDE
ncbi:MAG TPA: NlpC/P60 family protein [Solirubrobacterales bacterium]|nr:NlpC/P60 family protein [Solirubrobacterales bacterium]